MILAGDIGGTSTRLALFEPPVVVSGFSRTYSSTSLSRLEDAIDEFLAPGHHVEAACFGVAGPVLHGHASLPNLTWSVDSETLSTHLKLSHVDLLNDLEANAYGIACLKATDLAPLNEAVGELSGNQAILSVGTGLGEAGLYWNGERHVPIATEAGHADFAPRTDIEIDLLREVRSEKRRVSYERVLSGAGLHRIFAFVQRRNGHAQSEWLIEALQRNAAPAAISKAGLDGTCDDAVEALTMFVSCLGAEAGNLALRMMATGGVYLGGGIAPKILPALRDGTFMRAFTDKGRLQPLLESIPVRVILNDQTALNGAARYAAMHTPETPPGGGTRAGNAGASLAEVRSA